MNEESENPGAVADWKQDLRADFEAWLETLDADPACADGTAGPGETATDAPDLYSFYEQLAALSAETRKSNRRTAEAFNQWGQTFAHVGGDLKILRDQANRLAEAAARDGTLPRAQCLALIELFDRLRRIARAFAGPPRVFWWKYDAGWRKAWETQGQAFDILTGHFEVFLKKEGVVPIDAVGKVFDPVTMTALSAETTAAHPHHTVIEEIQTGYTRFGELLRMAHVKVSLRPAGNLQNEPIEPSAVP
ncbi:MAG TPA: nucleotide exchange factor GrpE [Chthoniobacterales bacterium]